MKKAFKRLFLLTTIVSLLIVCFAFSASAEKEDYYTYSVNNGEATITDVNTSISGDVIVPSTLGGYKVTSIGASAFGLCKNLTSIIIPDGVTSIGSSAFSSCTRLGSVTISDSVTSMGSSVFNNCTALTSITIPDSVTSIGSYTFNGCTSLSSVTIDGDISTIGACAFKGCKRLASVKIPDSVTEIGESAFENCTYLTSITIPESVTSIGPYTFSNCASITNITIPDAVTSIGAYTFAGCTSLKSIIIPENVVSIGSYVFTDCIALTNIKIPDDVTSIGPYTFSGCTALTSVTIPDAVTLIDFYLFNNCSALTNVAIPDGVTSIGDSAFSGCTSLRSFTVPDGVISIGSYAFYECKSLASITIPDSVTSMSYSVFRSCTALTDVTIGNGVMSIGDSTFRGCTELTSITIPESVTSIGSYVFYNTGYYNNSANWENGVLYIGNHLLEADDSIAFYNINQGTKTIAASAFENCKALTGITIPDSVITIGSYAFGNCTALKDIAIPDSVTRIGDYAFKACTSFTSITIPDTVTSFGNGVFHSCTNLESIEIPYGITSIGEYTFHSCTSLKSVTIPSEVTVIGNFAFYACERLENIDIPENVTSIGRFAFYNCPIPESIKIPDSVISIGDSAFLMCTNLKEILYEGTEEQWNAIILGNSNVELTNANVYYEHYNYHIIGDWLSADNGTHIKHCQNTYPCSYTETENCAFGEWSTIGEPTCDKEGAKQRVCDVCGYIQTQSIAVIAHTQGNVVTENTVEPKCEVMGSYDEVVYCLVCDAEVSRITKEIEKTQHIFEATTTKATLKENGKTEKECTACGKKETVTTFYYPKTIKLSSSEVTYNGKVRTPSLTVKDSKGNTLKNGTDYDVTTPSGRKTPGVYEYKITFKGNYSGAKELTFTILPKAPTKFSATQSTSVVKLTWSASAGATGYRVYQYSPSKGKYVQIASVKTTSYRKATNLKAGTEYKFKVKPYTKLSDGTVIWGADSDVFTTATECKAPKITSVTSPSKSKATVKWSNVEGETGFQLYYSTSKNGTYKKINSYSANKLAGSKTFSSSASGKTIYFKVRAYKKVNGQTIYSEWSAVKGVNLK